MKTVTLLPVLHLLAICLYGITAVNGNLIEMKRMVGSGRGYHRGSNPHLFLNLFQVKCIDALAPRIMSPTEEQGVSVGQTGNNNIMTKNKK